jgi:hypothetical protein
LLRTAQWQGTPMVQDLKWSQDPEFNLTLNPGSRSVGSLSQR